MRLWLLGLLVVSATAAGAVLFVNYKLESLRALVVEAAQTKAGTTLRFRAVSVSGVRGLRLDGVEALLHPPSGPVITARVPEAFVYIDLLALFSGDLAIERIQLDKATIRVELPADGQWLGTLGDIRRGTVPRSLGIQPFRLLGTEGRLEIVNVVGHARLLIDDLGFDISRLRESADIAARVSGMVDGFPYKRLDVKLSFTSADDFDVRVQCANITAADLNEIAPESGPMIVSGLISPHLRVEGYPGKTVVLALHAPFYNVALRDQPPFLDPITGTLTVLASYDRSERRVTLSTAKATSDQINGTLDGSISFKGVSPEFDLQFEASELPLAAILDYALRGRLDEHGKLELEFHEPRSVRLALRGTSAAPELSGQVSAAGGKLSFLPNDSRYPEGTLELGSMEMFWSPEMAVPQGRFSVLDGHISHVPSGVHAQKLSGTVILEQGQVKVEPVNAEITGNPFVGTLLYDLASDQGTFSVNGRFTQIEHTKLASLFKNTTVAGAVTVRCKARKDGEQYSLDAEIDATETQIDYKWWFSKPPGIGASGKTHVEYKPGRTILAETEAFIASSDVWASNKLRYNGSRWVLQSSRAVGETLDVKTMAKCLRIPYTVTGGTATKGHFEWVRDNDDKTQEWHSAMGCSIDEVAFIAKDGETPFHLKGVTVEATMNLGAKSTGHLVVSANKGLLPPMGTPWFVPMRTDATLLEKFPPVDRTWAYTLSARSLGIPPWKGSGFTAKAFTTLEESGLHRYRAKIDKGWIEGTFLSPIADSAFVASAKWADVPASYFIEYLDLPKCLTGNTTGEVHYAMDPDKPGTLEGEGHFEVIDGQFSADYIVSRLEEQVEDEMTFLPPSLKFSNLKADLLFQRDVVETPHIQFVAEGLKLTGNGRFVPNGEVDYTLETSVSPETAEKIQLLRDYFNVQGHRLAQQDIELTFKVTGPTLNPRGKLAKAPPLSVTLVSGALEITSEAFRVIDTPRKILVDLLKIGGGIVGATK